MPYTPTAWVNGVTAANATRMNNIETGVVNAVNGRAMVTVGATTGDFPVSSYANATAAVQAAVDSLGVTGGNVRIRRGTAPYDFTDQVTVANQYIEISGEGNGTQIRWATGGTYTGKYFFKTQAYGRVSNMLLNGNAAAVTGGGGVWGYGARLAIDHLYVQDFDQDGVHLEGTSSVLTAHAADLDHLRIISCGGYGLYIGAFAFDVSITRAWVATSNVGVYLGGGTTSVTDLHTWGHTTVGCQVRSHGNRLVNSYFDSNGTYGVDLLNANENLIEGSDIFESGFISTAAGISVAGTSTRTRIIGNVFRDNTGPGIDLAGTAGNTIIDGNQFRDTQGTKTQTYAAQSGSSTTSTLIANNSMFAGDHLTGSHNLSAGTFSSSNNLGIDPERYTAFGNVNGSSSVGLDRKLSSTISATLTGNWGTVTMPTTGVVQGSRLKLILTQDATGGRTITWPATTKLAGGALTLSAATKTDVVEFIFDGTNWREISRALNS